MGLCEDNKLTPLAISKPSILYGTFNKQSVRRFFGYWIIFTHNQRIIAARLYEGRLLEFKMAEDITSILTRYTVDEFSLDLLSLSLKFKETFYISSSLNVDIIVGMGFLQQHPFKIDFHSMKLLLEDFEFKFSYQKPVPICNNCQSSQPQDLEMSLPKIVDAQ